MMLFCKQSPSGDQSDIRVDRSWRSLLCTVLLQFLSLKCTMAQWHIRTVHSAQAECPSAQCTIAQCTSRVSQCTVHDGTVHSARWHSALCTVSQTQSTQCTKTVVQCTVPQCPSVQIHGGTVQLSEYPSALALHRVVV